MPERSNLFESHWSNQWLTQRRVIPYRARRLQSAMVVRDARRRLEVRGRGRSGRWSAVRGPQVTVVMQIMQTKAKFITFHHF